MPQGMPSERRMPAARGRTASCVRAISVPGVAAHPQCGHQVFEHRSGPGKKKKAAIDAGMIAAQLAPALLGKIAAGDGEECGDARLGCNQVVAGFMTLVLAHLDSRWRGSDGTDRRENQIPSPVPAAPQCAQCRADLQTRVRRLRMAREGGRASARQVSEAMASSWPGRGARSPS